MQSLKRLIPLSSVLSARLSRHQDKLFLLTSQHLAPGSSIRFLDIYQDSADEMNRGYFAHMSELKQHGGNVSFIDTWFLCWNSVKKLLIWVMKKSNYGGKDALQKQIVYSFGDHYYF